MKHYQHISQLWLGKKADANDATSNKGIPTIRFNVFHGICAENFVEMPNGRH